MADKVVSTVKNGQLVDITYTLEDKDEIEIFKKLIKSTMPTCPNCNEVMEPADEDYQLVINSPLQSFFGMDLGVPQVKCSKCNAIVVDDDDVDLQAFPSVMRYLTGLREEYKRRVAAAQKKRGT